jgi:hypothetical protein
LPLAFEGLPRWLPDGRGYPVRLRYLWAGATGAALLASGLAVVPASASVGAVSGRVVSGVVSGRVVSAGAVRPARVYAPYFQAYLPGSPSAAARNAGVRFVTLAFVQAAGKKGAAACTLTWNGVKSQPVSKGGYRAGIRQLEARHGGAIVSFGGFSADNGGTEIADSCHSVPAIAAAYEQVVRVDGVHRLDMDVEAKSLTNKGGIDRRNKAIAMLEAWARARHTPLWIQFTLGVEPSGFDQDTTGILRNAVKNGAKINSINLMVFDYYLGNEKKPLDMSALAIKAALSVHSQLLGIYRGVSSAGIWHAMGFTMLPGIDDYPHKTEITRLGGAQSIMKFAQARQMDFLSIWALQRDNGGCPGSIDSNTCSGIKQGAFAFSHLLESFTG